MKKIGILYDKESNKTFLLPNEVKALTEKGITVNVLVGLGIPAGVSEKEYLAAGAKIYNKWQTIIQASDIILKVNAFNKAELALMTKKIGITTANFLNNVDMLLYMLQNKVTGLEWLALANRSGYVFFPQLEELKASYLMKLIKDTLSRGLAKKAKDRVVYPKHPKLLILNATFAGVALAKLALAEGYSVTIADNDTKYLTELKNSSLENIDYVDSNFDTLLEQIRDTNVFVNTAINPTDLTKLRITKDMVESMPKGSLAIDAACEYGYAFHFIKKYADETIKWNKLGNSFYLAHEDLTGCFAKQASEIISKKSLGFLMDVVEQGTNNSTIWKITNCEDGKVVNSMINAKLKLY